MGIIPLIFMFSKYSQTIWFFLLRRKTNMSPRIIHRRRNLAEYALLVFFLSVLLLLPGCDFVREQVASIKMPRGTDLDFETIMFEGQHTSLNIDPGRIEVIVNDQLPPDVWITPEISSKIQAVDFSRNFVLVAMMGDMGSPGYRINVKRIWQKENTIYVKADFSGPKVGNLVAPVMTSPKQIVKVSKEKMTNFGEITFRLWDKFGREWATASKAIPP
jgi:hypothetical protein